ncbi:hypothetical protein BD779DRAFT_1679596 [Infundibulicybe gibba]|nr:hypothetical protein BD779DRAFT_1679596 [Infundibulicybe gibba]
MPSASLPATPVPAKEALASLPLSPQRAPLFSSSPLSSPEQLPPASPRLLPHSSLPPSSPSPASSRIPPCAAPVAPPRKLPPHPLTIEIPLPQPASLKVRYSLRLAEAALRKAMEAPGPHSYGIHDSELDFSVFGWELPPLTPTPSPRPGSPKVSAPKKHRGAKAKTSLPVKTPGKAGWQSVAREPALLPPWGRDPETPIRDSPALEQVGDGGPVEKEGGNGRDPEPGGSKKRCRGRKAPKSRPRAGQALANAGGDAKAADFSRLKEKRLETSELLQSAGFSMTKDSAISGTGWQGKQLQVPDRKRLQEIYQSDEIRTSLAQFLPVYYDESHERAVLLLDDEGRAFCYRTTVLPWIKSAAPSILEAVDMLLGKHLRDVKTAQASRERTRGPHFPCIMGHFRAYGEYPELTQFHVDNASDAEAFINNPAIQHVTNAVSSCLKMMFPRVVRRLQASAEWYETHHHIKPQFGFFWNLCINGIFPGQKRIHSKPHADYKTS